MIPDLVPSQFASNMISVLRFLSWRYKYGEKVSVFMEIKICHIFTPKWTMTTTHNIPECEHHQLHKLLGGRARLLRSHSPLLPSGGQLLQINGIDLVATSPIKLMPWKKKHFPGLWLHKADKGEQKAKLRTRLPDWRVSFSVSHLYSDLFTRNSSAN